MKNFKILARVPIAIIAITAVVTIVNLNKASRFENYADSIVVEGAKETGHLFNKHKTPPVSDGETKSFREMASAENIVPSTSISGTAEEPKVFVATVNPSMGVYPSTDYLQHQMFDAERESEKGPAQETNSSVPSLMALDDTERDSNAKSDTESEKPAGYAVSTIPFKAMASISSSSETLIASALIPENHKPTVPDASVAVSTQSATIDMTNAVEDKESNSPVRDIVGSVDLPPTSVNSLDITIDFPLPGNYTNIPAQLVTGFVDSVTNLKSIYVNGIEATLDGESFSAVVSLAESYNDLIATAEFVRHSSEDRSSITLDTQPPSMTSAISSASNQVLIQFDEAMHPDSIRSTVSFNIVREDTAVGLPVLSANFDDQARTVVVLQTGAQSSADYILTVANVKDLAGNPLAKKGPFTDPSVASFTGTSPSGGELDDTDGDGLLDHVEIAGWQVIVQRTDGEFEYNHVSSDPYIPDTDNDAVEDAEERHAGLNPRNSDTDGDTLSDDDEWNRIYTDPTDQDSDNDGLPDGLELNFFSTSPLLADTDGDQIDDFDELIAGNRDPLIADLPSPRITVGNVNLQLDTRFSFTNEAGTATTEEKSVESTLTQSEDKSFSNSNERSTLNTLGFSQEVSGTFNSGGDKTQFPHYSATITGGSEQGSERGSTVSVGKESSQGSEEAYHESLNTSTARDIRESVTREVIDAAMRVDLTIGNDGDIPFAISNLELTAQTQNPSNRRQMIPVASLVPENENLGSINIGALGDPERGPFVFKTLSIFPQQVEELMKNPRGLIVQLANFDITDQEGNNFAFTSQAVLDRTVGITFDLGDGRTESYRVATASDFDRASGQPSGISMARALEIIGLSRYPAIRDGGNGIVETFAIGDDVQAFPRDPVEPTLAVVTAGPNGQLDTEPAGDDKIEITPSGDIEIRAGLNGIVQTAASGDDVQAVPVHSLMIEPTLAVVTAGENGTIDTSPEGDDTLVEPDYETTVYVTQAVIRDGGNGIAETVVDPNDEQISAQGSRVQPGQVILRAGSDEVLDSIPDEDGDDVIVEPSAPRELLARYKDVAASADEKRFWALYATQDKPGVDLNDFQIRSGEQYDFAYVRDWDKDGVWAREEYLHGSSDRLFNTDGCDLNPAPEAPPCDTLTDAFEIQQGWRVTLRGSPQGYRVYPNPSQADSDRDRLLDDEEFACGLDPRLRDTDLDGLSDWEELRGKLIGEGGVAGPMVSRNPASNSIEYTIMPYDDTYAGPYEPQVPHDAVDGCNDALGQQGYATDPLKMDTDGDQVNDWLELQLGLNPNDSSDGAFFLDDDGDGLPNKIETDPTQIIRNREPWTVTSNPFDPDSDDDGLPDLLEYYLRSDPRERDTDGDGISDTDEYGKGGLACITTEAFQPCTQFKNLIEESYQDYIAQCEAADICDHAAIENNLDTIGARNLGTNLSDVDSDFDNKSDAEEIEKLTIEVNGGYVDIPAPSSDPLDPDTDDDGLLDAEEKFEWTPLVITNNTTIPNGGTVTKYTNPRARDTDGDNEPDKSEIQTLSESYGLRRDATREDKLVTIYTESFEVYYTDETGGADPVWFSKLSIDGYPYIEVCRESANGIDITANSPDPKQVGISPPCEHFKRVIFDDTPIAIALASDGYESDGAGTRADCTVKYLNYSYNSNTDDGDERTIDHNDCIATVVELKFRVPFKVRVE